MALVITLVHATPHRLLYLLSRDDQAGNTATIANDAGASPDLQTDVNGSFSGSGQTLGAVGPSLRNIARARVDGIGPIAAGAALNQAQARAILNSDDNARAVLTNNNVPRAVMRLTGRDIVNAPGEWLADANVDGAGDPIVNVTAPTANAACVALLEIMFRHSEQL